MGSLDRPPLPASFPAALRQHVRARAEHPAFCFEGRETRYAEFERRCSCLAGALAREGVGADTRIGYLGKNSDRFFELLMAAAMTGAVLVPIGWRLSASEVAAIIDDAGCAMLFVDETGAPLGDEVRGLTRRSPTLVRVDGPGDWETDQETLISLGIAHDWHEEALPDAPFLQLYTSGTTGRPKGVLLSQANFFAMRRTREPGCEARWDQWDANDIALVAMPIAHIGGIGLGMLSLYNGSTAVVAREFRAGDVLDYIERDGVNRIFLVPAAIRIMLEDPRVRSVDYSRMRSIVYGASPIPLELLREAVEVFGCGFVQTYGMTETMGTIVSLDEADHGLSATPRMRSAGRPMDGVEIRIVGPDGQEVPAGGVGEVLVRSAATMLGYWRQPEETARALSPEGWLGTGDAGYFDADGYLYLHDRVKDMIISGGENVYPAEVESAIFGHPAVRDVAVIGVPDKRWGEAVRAVVVRDASVSAGPEEIIAWARERLAAYKTPKSVDFVDELPRNAAGKILKRELRDRHAGSPGATDQP